MAVYCNGAKGGGTGKKSTRSAGKGKRAAGSRGRKK